MAKLNHEVVIQRADNGVVVRVGCKTLVFTDISEFVTDLERLLNGEESALRGKYYPEEKRALIQKRAYEGEDCAVQTESAVIGLGY